MLVGRFSDTGFDPVFQSWMKDIVDAVYDWNEEECKRRFPKRWKLMKIIHTNGLMVDSRFSYNGVHVFFLPLKDQIISFELSHLRGHRPSYHEKEFDDNTVCYMLGGMEERHRSTLSDLLKLSHRGAYIPSSKGD